MSLQIFEQPTPNPHAMKYILSQDVLRTGKVTFTDVAECKHVPLAQALLELPAVKQVHFFENVITVTQEQAGSVGQIVMDIIRAKMEGHDPDFNQREAEKIVNDRADLTPELQKIEAILDEKIRPALQMDGGDLDVVAYDATTKRLRVLYQGACGGCPSSSAGTLMAIQGILRDEFEPALEVVADDAAVPHF